MFSKEMTDLIKGDNLEVLKLLAQYNPERFKEDVHSITEKGNSFFVLLTSKNNELEYVKGLLELCESFGYDFTEKKRPHHEDDVYKLIEPKHKKSSYNYGNTYPLNNKNPEFTPEYITAFAYIRNDEAIAFLTEKMGKEKMLQLEQDGWPILEYAYRKEFPKTIELLCDYGFDYDNTPSGLSIVKIIENNSNFLDLYWKIKNAKENNNHETMSESQFKTFYDLYESNIKTIDSTKSYRTDEIIKLVNRKKDVLTVEQKEKLLIRSMPVPDDRIFKSIAKLLKYKQKGPELTNLVLSNLENTYKHQLLYWVVENPDLFFKHIGLPNENDPLKQIHGIDKIIHKCSAINIRPGYTYELDKNKKMVNEVFLNRFKDLFKNENILLREFDNGLNLFEKIIFNIDSRSNLLQFTNIRPKKSTESENSIFKTLNEETFNRISNGSETFSDEQRAEIREVLNKTWYRQHNGKCNLEQAKRFDIFNSNYFLFDKTIMQDQSIYTNEQKMEIFKSLVEDNSHRMNIAKPIDTWKEKDKSDNYANRLLKDLYFILSEDHQTKWSNFNLDEDTINNLKNTEFLYELKARQLTEELQGQLKDIKEKPVKPKLKM